MPSPEVAVAPSDILPLLEMPRYIGDHYSRRLWRAIMLSPTIEICEALLRGENVPTSQLDPLWVKRLGIR